MLTFTGYDEKDVKSAIETIRTESSKFNIKLGESVLQKRLLKDQPKLRGCDESDLTIFSVIITGEFENAKNLVKVRTPYGVQIDLLPFPGIPVDPKPIKITIEDGFPSYGNELELSTKEAERVIEQTNKHNNRIKEEGRQGQRTLKDKENQRKMDELEECIQETEEGDIVWEINRLNSWVRKRIEEAGSTYYDATESLMIVSVEDMRKHSSNQKIVDEIKKMHKTCQQEGTMPIPGKRPELHPITTLEKIVKAATGKDIKDL